MKQNYDTKKWYELDIEDFNVKTELKAINIYDIEYVKKINDTWIDVLEEIYIRDGDIPAELNEYTQTFSIDRGNTAGDKYIYDIGFNINEAKKVIIKQQKQPLKVENAFIDNEYYISYTPRTNPSTHTPNEPIIVVPDLVTSRETVNPSNNTIPHALLVIDGNNRVTLMKQKNKAQILSYYISLEEMLENDVFINKFDEAVYSQMADLVYILKHINHPDLNNILKRYYDNSYLKRYFNEYIK